jgi:hypothetical protein
VFSCALVAHGSVGSLTVSITLVRRLPVPTSTAPGLTTADLARGELVALNTAEPGGRPRWIVTAEALAEFERRRAGGPAPKTVRRKRVVAAKDYTAGW